MTDPLRLLDGGSELTPDERRALAASRHEPSPIGAKRAIWTALSVKLAAPATAAAMTSATSGTSTAVAGASGASVAAGASTLTAVALVKSASIGIALGAAVGTGLYFGARPETPRPAPVVVASEGRENLGATAVPAPFHAAARTNSAPPAAAASDSAPILAASEPSVERSTPRGDVSPTGPTRAPVSPAPDGESRRVAAARAELRAGNAAAALVTLDTLARDEPNGLLGQEREALRIAALAALGRRDAARAAAAQFLARYPKSPHAAAVRHAAGDSP